MPDRDRDAEPRADLLTRASPYPTSRLAPRIDLVDLAREIEQADAAVGMVASAKLEAIREQMMALKAQAERVLEEARAAARLHRARCAFKKIPGHTYHLYARDDGDLYFSMLSPDDWRGAPPHRFEGSYVLQADMSFAPLSAAAARGEQLDPRALVGRLLGGEGPP